MPFIAGSGREPFNITESQIKYAIQNTRSNAEAARFLNVSTGTYKKYASMYKDETTGKTLYELHKNIPGAGIPKVNSGINHGTKLSEILEGKHPTYDLNNFKKRLFKSGLVPMVCSCCGYSECRVDGEYPLLLDFKDENITNFKEDNIQLLCYNCYFVNVGSFTGRRRKYFY